MPIEISVAASSCAPLISSRLAIEGDIGSFATQTDVQSLKAKFVFAFEDRERSRGYGYRILCTGVALCSQLTCDTGELHCIALRECILLKTTSSLTSGLSDTALNSHLQEYIVGPVVLNEKLISLGNEDLPGSCQCDPPMHVLGYILVGRLDYFMLFRLECL